MGVISSRVNGDAKLTAEERTAKLGHELLHAIRVVTEALAELSD